MKKQAFTLVELIVVITILAILSTIAFISLSGYSKEARDSKRISDTRNLLIKINLEQTKGKPLSELIVNTQTESGKILGTLNSEIKTFGISNFDALKEDSKAFKDPSIKTQDYPVAYAVGGTGSGAYKFFEIATISEKENTTKIMGNYYKLELDDEESLFLTGGVTYKEGGIPIYNLDNGAGIVNNGGGKELNCEKISIDGYLDIPDTNYGKSTTKTKNISENNGIFTYEGTFNCENGTFTKTNEILKDFTCNENYTKNTTNNKCEETKLILNGNTITKGSATNGLYCLGNDIIISFSNGSTITMAGCDSRYNQCSNPDNCPGDKFTQDMAVSDSCNKNGRRLPTFSDMDFISNSLLLNDTNSKSIISSTFNFKDNSTYWLNGDELGCGLGDLFFTDSNNGSYASPCGDDKNSFYLVRCIK